MAASIRSHVMICGSILERHQHHICLVSRRFKGLKRHTLKVLNVDEANNLLPKSVQPNRITSPVLSLRKTNTKQVKVSNYLEKYPDNLKHVSNFKSKNGQEAEIRGNNVGGLKKLDLLNASGSRSPKLSAFMSREISYEYLEDGDKKFGPCVLAAKSPFQRGKHRTVLLEGSRLISDAISAGVAVKALYFTQPELLSELPVKDLMSGGTKLYRVRGKQMKVWSDMTTPPGIMAICIKPKTADLHRDNPLPITLICDSVKDASEMGAILRSAAAACCEKIILTRGCVDAWDCRVLRAGAGAQFHTHIIEDVEWDLMHSYLESCDQFYINQTTGQHNQTTEQNKQTIEQHNQTTEQHKQTIEQHNQTTEQHKQTTEQYNHKTVQHNPTTVQCNQTTAQQNQTTVSQNLKTNRGNPDLTSALSQEVNTNDEVARNSTSEPTGHNQDTVTLESADSVYLPNLRGNSLDCNNSISSRLVRKFDEASSTIGTCYYYELNMSSDRDVAVIVSGSAEGLSKEARRYVTGSGKGLYVRIPYLQPVSPLSLATTTSVLLFEIKRQLSSSE